MACKCNVCVGTGRCAACSGSGDAAGSEPQSFRATRRDRLYSPAPQLSGVWRYRALLSTQRKPGLMTSGEKMAKPEPAPASPECAGDKIWPCSAGCWRPCDRCHKLICEKHDHLVPVWPSGNGGCDPADMVCRECIAALWYRGDISQSAQVQYLC